MTDESAGYVTIGEAALRSGMPPKTIRFYEQIGLIRPAQRFANQYRAYSEKDVHTLKFVHRARNLGFSLKDIQALLSLYRDRRRASRDDDRHRKGGGRTWLCSRARGGAVREGECD